jgi:hypothetical protein
MMLRELGPVPQLSGVGLISEVSQSLAQPVVPKRSSLTSFFDFSFPPFLFETYTSLRRSVESCCTSSVIEVITSNKTKQSTHSKSFAGADITGTIPPKTS